MAVEDQSKQSGMKASWNKMNSDYSLAISAARDVHNAAIEKARDAEKEAKKQYNNALRSGDQAAIDKAKSDLDNAKAAKEQADIEYRSAKEQAKSVKQRIHDELRSAEKADSESRSLTDIQEEQTEKLNNVNNQGSNGQESDNGGKDMSKDNDKKGLGFQFSQSFYDTVGSAIKGQPTGNLADVKSKGANAQAQNLRNAAATNQMEAQRAQQIANQNPYAEAGKMASVQNDTENRQNVQKSGVLGAGAALARKTNTPDVQSQMAREDQQQNIASQRREEEQANQQEATEKGNESEQWQLKSRDFTEDRDQSAALSRGEPAGTEQTDNTKTEQTDNTKTEQTDTTETEQPADKPAPMPSGNPQHVINALLGSSKGQDLRSGQDGAADKELYDWAISQGVTPLQAGQHKNEDDVNSWEQEFITNNGEAGQNVIQQLRQGRVGEGNDASRNFGADEMDQMNQSMTVTNNPPSDARVKDIKQCLCDARMKWIKEDWDRDGKPSREDMIWLMNQQGPFHHNNRDYDPNDYDSWDDEDGSILGAYADNIKNYVYSYKPEATQVDPSIDPNQEHIGPMAQDIEKVNPSCIKETPEGVKTVDINRLAMMNSGAIGDLAREVQDLKARLAKLEV